MSKLKSKGDSIISRGRDPIFFTHQESSPKAGVKGSDEELIPTIYSMRVAPQALCRVVKVYPGLEKQARYRT